VLKLVIPPDVSSSFVKNQLARKPHDGQLGELGKRTLLRFKQCQHRNNKKPNILLEAETRREVVGTKKASLNQP
jgi:hypothetical protein